MDFAKFGDIYGKLGVKVYDDFDKIIEPRIECAKKLTRKIDHKLQENQIIILNEIQIILNNENERYKYNNWWYKHDDQRYTKLWRVKLCIFLKKITITRTCTF